jgi:hypothetical protein
MRIFTTDEGMDTKQEDLGFEIAKLPILVHPSTPPNFECRPGCLCCCRTTILLKGEVSRISKKSKDSLIYHDGVWMTKLRFPGMCLFFNSTSALHCKIFEDRPLRCKLYPYVPLIVDKAIWIFAEPFLDLFAVESCSPLWHRCYGLGKGPDVMASIKEKSRLFLSSLVEENPKFLKDNFVVKDPESHLCEWEIKKFKTPLFDDWDTDRIKEHTKP